MKSASRLKCRRLSLGLLALAFLPGCGVPGALAYKVFGPTKVAAEYAPPKDQPIVVLVENYRNPADLQQPSDELAAMISTKLEAAKVAPVVPLDKLVALRTEKGPAFDKMKIPDIGKAVGARQIIYVNLKQFTFEGFIGASDVRCKYTAIVKVVDADTGQTKWPDTGDGKEFSNTSDYNPSEGKKTEQDIQDAILDDLSDGISALFYRHQPQNEMPKD